MSLQKKDGKGAAGKAAFLLPVLLFCALFWGMLPEEPALPGTRLLEKPPGGCRVLLAEDREAVLLACGGEDFTSLLRLDRDTGEVLARREVKSPVHWAALRGGKLFLLAGDGPQTELLAWDPSALEEVSRRALELEPEKLLRFTCTGSGWALAVTTDRPCILQGFSPDGSRKEWEFPEEIGFLEANPQSGALLWAGDVLYAAADGDVQEFPGTARPLSLLGEALWIDEDGVLCRLGEKGPEPFLRAALPVYPSSFPCLDGEKCLILSEGDGTIRRYDGEGKAAGACRVDGGVRGLCSAGAVYEKDGALFYAAFRFAQSSPEPSLSPAPSPSAAPKAPVWAEGDLLVALPGTTAAQLRELRKPDVTELRDSLGQAVTQGKLATGMTVGGSTVVVLGDCDGTGSVTGADVRKAMEWSRDSSSGERAFLRTADLDGDGEITGGDLVLLSQWVWQGSTPVIE